jgi:hypothetical protein
MSATEPKVYFYYFPLTERFLLRFFFHAKISDTSIPRTEVAGCNVNFRIHFAAEQDGFEDELLCVFLTGPSRHSILMQRIVYSVS